METLEGYVCPIGDGSASYKRDRPFLTPRRKGASLLIAFFE